MHTELGPLVKPGMVDYEVEQVDFPLHPKNSFLLEYWSSKADSAGRVYRRDISPAELKKVLGGLFIVEPVDDGTDILYRLVGSENERRLGMLCMGRRFTECYSPEMAADQIVFHNEVLKSGKPAYLRGRLLGLDLEYATFEASYFPLYGENGAMQIMGGMYDLAEKG